MTHYDTLGVNENASLDEIKKAYRKLANQHHPDKGGDTNRFQQIQAAYDAIGDEQRRAQYDSERRGGAGFRFTVNGHDMGSGMPHDMEEMLRNFGFGFNFGPGFASHGDPFGPFRQTRKNKDIQVSLKVTLASTLEAQSKTISVQNTQGERFPVTVNIPRGIRPNSSIKFPNLGDNFFESLPRGDLYVKIEVENNSQFLVNEYDIIKIVEIDCVKAMLGGSIQIEGLDGKVFDLNISPGTQPDSKFRIHNQGLYVMNQSNRGHLIVHVKINVPSNLQSSQIDGLKTIFNIQ
jgi:DnaJ-class molecular chaperone